MCVIQIALSLPTAADLSSSSWFPYISTFRHHSSYERTRTLNLVDSYSAAEKQSSGSSSASCVAYWNFIHRCVCCALRFDSTRLRYFAQFLQHISPLTSPPSFKVFHGKGVDCIKHLRSKGEGQLVTLPYKSSQQMSRLRQGYKEAKTPPSCPLCVSHCLK